MRAWRTQEEEGGIIRISVYSWRRHVLDDLIAAAREHYIQHAKPRLLEDQGAKSESVITAYIEQPDRIFDYLCDFLGSARAWGNVRQVYVSTKANGPSWGIDQSASDSPITLESTDMPVPHDQSGKPIYQAEPSEKEQLELANAADDRINSELAKRLSKRQKLNYRPAADRPQLFKWRDHWIQVTRDMGSRDWRTGKEEGGKLTLSESNFNSEPLHSLTSTVQCFITRNALCWMT